MAGDCDRQPYGLITGRWTTQKTPILSHGVYALYHCRVETWSVMFRAAGAGNTNKAQRACRFVRYDHYATGQGAYGDAKLLRNVIASNTFYLWEKIF